jgi:hypothetical protein
MRAITAPAVADVSGRPTQQSHAAAIAFTNAELQTQQMLSAHSGGLRVSLAAARLSWASSPILERMSECAPVLLHTRAKLDCISKVLATTHMYPRQRHHLNRALIHRTLLFLTCSLRRP